jgi:hypothetical protein
MIPNYRSASSRFLRLAAPLVFAAVALPALEAQVIVSGPPTVGSSNTVPVEPGVPRPSTHTCTAQLFTNLEFADYNAKSFSYTPPAACAHAAWSKVVFEADFTVTAGLQYDRTEQFYLGGANLLYGTTPEPRSNLSPKWHVESDVTDLSAIFKTAQTGSAILGNFVGNYNGTEYTGIIYANAKLVFYLTGPQDAAPAVPSEVIGLPGNGGAATLNDSSSVYAQSLSLPTNVTKAYIDVIAQGQNTDEFWYFNVPNNLTSVLENYGNTAFRETEIYIDGVPAGVAPVYPWVFTGGVDPFLWEPLPGFDTLNFKPFRVDLTPFAGLLSNGKQHTIGLRVYNADNYFLIAANLLLYTDPKLAKVTGKVTTNTLTLAVPETITPDITSDGNGDAYGSVTVGSSRSYQITGEVETSAGLQTTTVERIIHFTNTQYFTLNASAYLQNAIQSTEYKGNTYINLAGVNTHETLSYSYPFNMNYNEIVNADGSVSVLTKASQQYQDALTQSAAGQNQYSETTSYVGTAQDTLNYDANFNYLGNSGARSDESYISSDSNANCYSKELTSANVKLTSVTSSTACSE